MKKPEKILINGKTLAEILESHKRWWNEGCEGGMKADLSGVDFRGVKYDEYTSFFPLQCPEEGSYIGWKKAGECIVKLRITDDAKRSSATTRKCRASAAEVLEIQNLDGTKANISSVSSDHKKDFVYEIGKIVEVKDFDDDRWNEYSTGIHHFITRQEAVNC